MKKFTAGQKVILKANADEGWPEETGKFVGYEDKGGFPDMCVVMVDDAYRRSPTDDGLREILLEGIEAAPAKKGGNGLAPWHPFVATPNKGTCGSCGRPRSSPIHNAMGG